MMTRLLSARAVNPAKRGTARLFMPAERAKSYSVQQINNLFLKQTDGANASIQIHVPCPCTSCAALAQHYPDLPQ